MMRCALATFALMVGLPLSAPACLWDRDTPAKEAEGMPEVIARCHCWLAQQYFRFVYHCRKNIELNQRSIVFVSAL